MAEQRSQARHSSAHFSAEVVRADFPLLASAMNGQPLVYLDNAATTQKPKTVIDALRHYYEQDNANVHRSAHSLSDRATTAFEAARSAVQHLIHAPTRESVLFTRGTTESINLVANSYGGAELGPGDEILLTAMEHHSNIVPWQMIAERTGARIKVVPVTESGELEIEVFNTLLSERTRIFGLVHVSNALGTINPVADLIAKAHEVGALVLVDGAQAMVHLPVDVQELDCDFYAFSGHKMLGPTGIGVLYGRQSLLEQMPPWQGGGEMIERVSFEATSWNRLPYKFEAGTPNIAGAIGLTAAVRYLQGLDFSAVKAHEDQLVQLAIAGLSQIAGIRLVGTANARAGVVSFLPEDGHPHDIGTLLNEQGIATRTGHHCAMPLMQMLGISGTVRASFCLYNTKVDVEYFIQAVRKACSLFGGS